MYPSLQFIAKNGVLRVAPIEVTETDETGNQKTTKKFPLMQFVDSSFTISLYPLGVRPPDPTDDPTATTTPGDTTPGNTTSVTKRPAVSTTLPPVPPHGPAMKGFFGFPPPESGTVIGSLTYEWANCRSSELCRWTSNVISGGGFDTPLQIPGNFEGEVNFSLNIGYMILRQVTYENCPKNWSVFANYTGVGPLTITGITPN